MNLHQQTHPPAVGIQGPMAVPPFGCDLAFLLKKKKGKKDCCEKFRKGKRCKGCPMRCCA
jgi:hypothetical protein